jgi:GntR family transcriptional regulator, transcriptional repressor for pyruvate dehydrogenase complex
VHIGKFPRFFPEIIFPGNSGEDMIQTTDKMTQTTEKPRKPSLTDRVSDLLRQRLTGGEFAVGDRLPKEQALCDTYSVSRTVIREALARLKADGLVEARHGVGFFATEPVLPKVQTDFMTGNFDRTSSILEALELRRGVEVEAAGLAARRRSPAQESRIIEAYQRLKAALEEDASIATDADLDLHRAIAEATNNPFIPEFLDLVVERTKSRTIMAGHGGDEARRLNQTENLLDEHRYIVEAICKQDSEKARDAMRAHLEHSETRFRLSASSNL